MAEETWRWAGATSPGRIIWTPANNVLVALDSPRMPGFSRISTRRSASSAVIKRLVMESGALITAEEAERRVLILENPGMRGESKATNTLFAGVQMILPGEVAPAHRHVSSAIRFVLDGDGAYTAVEGEKAYMSPGDFVITANWARHDHGNTSKKP